MEEINTYNELQQAANYYKKTVDAAKKALAQIEEYWQEKSEEYKHLAFVEARAGGDPNKVFTLMNRSREAEKTVRYIQSKCTIDDGTEVKLAWDIDKETK